MPQQGTNIIAQILLMNKDKNFVKRILNFPIFPVLDNGDGSISTHSMAWGEADGKYFVYPTVVQGGDGKLRRLSGRDAWDYAIKNNEYIQFDTKESADWFARNYKKYLEK